MHTLAAEQHSLTCNMHIFKHNNGSSTVLVINQLDAQNLFYNKYISCLYMFQAPCAHCQEVKIVLYSIWYHHTYMFQAPCDHRQEVKIVLYSLWYHHTYMFQAPCAHHQEVKIVLYSIWYRHTL